MDSDRQSDHEMSRKRIKLEDHSEHTLRSVDELLQQALALQPDLKWNVKGVWCRYCGARGSAAFYESPWGPETLCTQHHATWKNGEWQLKADAAPSDPAHALKLAECTERAYLMAIIDGDPNRTTSDHDHDETTASESDSDDEDYDEEDDSDAISEESDLAADDREADLYDCFTVTARCKICKEAFDDFGIHCLSVHLLLNIHQSPSPH